MKGWLRNMLYSSDPQVRKLGKKISERQRRQYDEDWERLRQSPAYTGNKPDEEEREPQ